MKNEFRYSGPKPRTKETGILMLADTIEATIRSLDRPNISRIENLIESLVKENR